MYSQAVRAQAERSFVLNGKIASLEIYEQVSTCANCHGGSQ
jgi:hypothetical protein